MRPCALWVNVVTSSLRLLVMETSWPLTFHAAVVRTPVVVSVKSSRPSLARKTALSPKTSVSVNVPSLARVSVAPSPRTPANPPRVSGSKLRCTFPSLSVTVPSAAVVARSANGPALPRPNAPERNRCSIAPKSAACCSSKSTSRVVSADTGPNWPRWLAFSASAWR